MFNWNKVYGNLEQMHDYDKDDEILIVDGNVWAVNDKESVTGRNGPIPEIPDDAVVMLVKVLTIKKEDI